MYVRLAFSIAIHSDPDILLVDEVLAVGDEPFQTKCMQKIQQFRSEGRSIILVSHSADQIINVCDKAVVLRQGSVLAEGNAVDAMAVLHQEYQRAMAKAMGHTVVSAARIHSVHVEGALAQSSTTRPGTCSFISGQDLPLVITTQAHQTCPDYALLVTLKSNHGQHVMTIDTRKMDISLPPLHGTQRFELLLPTLGLGSGDFVVTATLVDEKGFEMSTSPRNLVISARPPHRGTVGVLSCDVHLKVVDSPSLAL